MTNCSLSNVRLKPFRFNTFFQIATVLICLSCSGVCVAQESQDPSSKVKKPETAKATTSSKSKKDEKPPSDGWHLFRGDAASTGVAKTELPDDLEIVWEFEVPKGGFEGSPLIVATPNSNEKTVYVGDMDGTLYSLDLMTGDKNWASKTPLGFAASPAYQDGKIFIGDIDGYFYCFDQKGKELWKMETMGEISGGASFYKGNVLFGSQDANLYLLNVEDGSEVSKHETPDQIRCSTTVAGNRAFVAGCDGFLHVIELDTGEEIGNVNINSPTQSTPAALGEQVFFGTEQAEFIAVNWKSAKADWSFADDNGQASVRGSAAVTDGHVVFGARNRQVYSVSPATGKKNWAVTLKANVDASPIIVGDHVYVGSTDGRFYKLALKDGKKIWEKQFNGGFLSSPAAAFGKLVIATDRGVVYCLGKKSP